jgi:hypothetical protein
MTRTDAYLVLRVFNLIEMSQYHFCVVLLSFLCMRTWYGYRSVIVPPPIWKPLAVVKSRKCTDA